MKNASGTKTFYTRLVFAVCVSVLSLAFGCLDNHRNNVVVTPPPPPTVSYPSVLSVLPLHGEISVATNIHPSITFSEPVDPNTVIASSVKLLKNGIPVSCVVSAKDAVVTLMPVQTLEYSVLYTGVVTTAVKNLSGNALQQEYRWSFTTQGQANPTYPSVLSTIPAANATNVLPATQITVSFNEPVAAVTVNTNSFGLYVGTTPVTGTVSLDTTGKLILFNPSATLAYGTVYTAVVTTAIKNMTGGSLQQEYRWSFTTASAVSTPVTPFTLDAQFHAVNVATDSVGNVYAYGYFNSPIPDVFVAKFTANGTLAWNTSIATPDIDWPQGGIVATDTRVYIQRYRQASGGSGSTSIFVDAFSASNGTVLWSTQVDTGSMPSALALDDTGTSVYATNTHNTVKLDMNGAILVRSTSGGNANTFAFGSFFFAGTSYVDATNLTDRYLTRTDTGLVATWTEWRRDTFNQDVISLAASATNALLFVAEDSYTATASSVTFQPCITAYKITSGGGAASVAWTKSLAGGRVTAAAAGTSGLYVMLDGVPPSLQKLDVNGNVLWTVPISQGGLGLAEYADKFVYIASGSTILVFDATTGTKQ